MKAFDEPDVINLLGILEFYFQKSFTELYWKKGNDDVSWEFTTLLPPNPPGAQKGQHLQAHQTVQPHSWTYQMTYEDIIGKSCN